MRWELVIAVHDLLVDTDRVVIVKWGIASEHLKDEDSERPPVDVFVVAFGLDDFGSQVLWCSTQSISLIRNLFGKTEIRNLNVAIPVDEQILWLQVSIGDIR